jgi:hypothetical protein
VGGGVVCLDPAITPLVRSVELSVRTDNLSFEHHEVVAALPPAEQAAHKQAEKEEIKRHAIPRAEQTLGRWRLAF